MTAQEYKLIFTGQMGAGKTTAIASISEIAPIKTEVSNTDKQAHQKEHTTVAMDYGEVQLSTGDRLRLYGTPGQERFRFMWNILQQGALGVIILVDNSQQEAVQSMKDYISAFKDLVRCDRAVVGVGRMETHPEPSIAKYAQALEDEGLDVPVFSIDVRRSADVLLMLDVLMNRIEVREMLDQLEA